MGNKIFGRITNQSEGGTPVPGLKIEAWDDDWPQGEDFMAASITDSNGAYEISYDAGIWDQSFPGLSTWLPDIFVTASIKNAAGRWVRLAKSQVFKNHDLARDLRIDLQVKIGAPLSTQTGFKPDRHGFLFPNQFKLQPDLLGVDLGRWEMGLCGGMCASARHHFLDHTEIPPDTSVPAPGTALFDELLKRQVRSTPPEQLARIYDWQSAPDIGAWWLKPSIGQRTKKEWPLLMSELDKRIPVMLILIRSNGYFANPTRNHQVLATGYEFNPATKDLTIQVYDPNHPLEIHHLAMNLGLPDGKLYLKDSTRKRTRGFFVNPAGQAASA